MMTDWVHWNVSGPPGPAGRMIHEAIVRRRKKEAVRAASRVTAPLRSSVSYVSNRGERAGGAWRRYYR